MVLERLKEYIDFKSINIAQFEKEIGMSNNSFRKSLKNGGAIGSDKLENILNKYPDINSEWLLTGKGNMLKEETYKISVTDKNALQVVRELSAENALLKKEIEDLKREKKDKVTSLDVLEPIQQLKTGKE